MKILSNNLDEGVTLINIMLISLLGPPVENKLIFFIRLLQYNTKCLCTII